MKLHNMHFFQPHITSTTTKYRVTHDLRTLLQTMLFYVFVIKKVPTNMCLILDGYRAMSSWNLGQTVRII